MMVYLTKDDFCFKKEKITVLKYLEERSRQLYAVSLSPVHTDRGNRDSEDRSLAGAVLSRKVLAEQADAQVLPELRFRQLNRKTARHDMRNYWI